MGKFTSVQGMELHDLLLKFQKQQRFVAAEAGATIDQVVAQLGHAEESILFILDSEPDKNVKQLAERIMLERSWTSRVVTGLEKRRLIKSLPAPGDRRAKLLRLTAKGRQLLIDAEAFVKVLMERCLAPLESPDRQRLEMLLKRLADGLGAYDYQRHSAGHPLAYQLGRLSAVTGVLGRSLFNSGLSNTQLHVLYALEEFSRCLAQVSDINRLVPADLSTVSRTLQDYEQRGWVLKEQSKRDKRSYSVQLASAGRKTLEGYRNRAGRALAQALCSFTLNEFQELCGLLSDLTGALPQRDPAAALGEQLILKELRSESEITHADDILKRSTNVAAAAKKQLGIYRDGELVGVIVAQPSPDGGSVAGIQFAGAQLPVARCLAMLKSCLTSLVPRGGEKAC